MLPRDWRTNSPGWHGRLGIVNAQGFLDLRTPALEVAFGHKACGNLQHVRKKPCIFRAGKRDRFGNRVIAALLVFGVMAHCGKPKQAICNVDAAYRDVA